MLWKGSRVEERFMVLCCWRPGWCVALLVGLAFVVLLWVRPSQNGPHNFWLKSDSFAMSSNSMSHGMA